MDSSSSSPPPLLQTPHSPPTTSPLAEPPPLPEIVFFDVETTVPSKPGQGYALLEFGAILVCPRRLVELGSYSTLIRPADLSVISASSIRCNGITRETVEQAPSFAEVAHSVYNILHGRIWAGHNIVKFDCARIREAFAEIGRPPPDPKGMLDSLPLLTLKFGRRAGNMKMATLAAYFGLGQQKHRSLDDVRMNLEVVKYCATVLFLESSLPELSSLSPPRSQSIRQTIPAAAGGIRGKFCPALASLYPTTLGHPPVISGDGIASAAVAYRGDACGSLAEPSHGINDILSESGTTLAPEAPAALDPLLEQMETSLHVEANNDESVCLVEHMETTSHTDANNPGPTSLEDPSSSRRGFLEASGVLEHHIHAITVPASVWRAGIVILHKDAPLQLSCHGVRILFGVSPKFIDHSGRPKLSVVLEARDEYLRRILSRCDAVAKQLFMNSGSLSEWRSLIKDCPYSGAPTVRLNIPTAVSNSVAVCASEIYRKDVCGNTHRMGFSITDGKELESLLPRGALIDAYFAVETYDFQQMAGLRLVAKCLTVYS